MSTKVQLRREAASFLASYVGAPGEVLVDTTNNRALVQDGATPGGFAAAKLGDLPGRNAVINGTFGINQRLYASAASLSPNAYGHDRWKAGASGCNYAFTQAVPDTQVSIGSGSLIQAIDAPNIYAAAYWLTWSGTATARVWQGSASGSFVAGTPVGVGGVAVNALLVTGLSLGTITNLEFQAGTLGLVQFEAALPNAGPTRFERRHNELALCQRYLEYISNLIFSMYTANSGAGYYYSLPMKVTKRAAPTVTLTNLAVNGFTTTPGLNAVSADQVIAVFTTSAAGDGLFAQFSAKMEAEL